MDQNLDFQLEPLWQSIETHGASGIPHFTKPTFLQGKNTATEPVSITSAAATFPSFPGVKVHGSILRGPRLQAYLEICLYTIGDAHIGWSFTPQPEDLGYPRVGVLANPR